MTSYIPCILSLACNWSNNTKNLPIKDKFCSPNACYEAFCDVLKSFLEKQMADSMNEVIVEAKKNKYSLIPMRMVNTYVLVISHKKKASNDLRAVI